MRTKLIYVEWAKLTAINVGGDLSSSSKRTLYRPLNPIDRLVMTALTPKESALVKLNHDSNQHRPVIRSLRHGRGFKVLALGFQANDVMDEHLTKERAVLIVVFGSILFKTKTESVELTTGMELEIPMDVVHSVHGIEPSTCLLIIG